MPPNWSDPPGGRFTELIVLYYTASKNIEGFSVFYGIHNGPGESKVSRYALFILWVLLLFLLPASAAEHLIMVFPLDGPSGSDALQWLGEGIAVSLANQLDGPQLQSVGRSERIRLIESLDLPPGARLSHGSMIRAAQRANADWVVLGGYSGTEKNLRISVRVLNVKTLKLSGDMVANGPLSNLPQMENELAWLVLSNHGIEKAAFREKFKERIRKIPNTPYAFYIQSLNTASETEQFHLLLRAAEAYRDFPDVQFRLGRIYFHQGDCGNAIPHLLLGGSEPGTQPEVEFMRGTCLLQGDQLLPSIQAFLQLFQFSRPFEALNNIGVAYLRKGDLALALNAFLEARMAARTDATVALNLALVRHLQGNDSAARTILEEACKSNPKNGMLQFIEGIVLRAQGDNERAASATARAKSLGMNVEKLQSEDPKMWSKVLSNMESR
jgi:tetratricopeptide (TPR) repeat protein